MECSSLSSEFKRRLTSSFMQYKNVFYYECLVISKYLTLHACPSSFVLNPFNSLNYQTRDETG